MAFTNEQKDKIRAMRDSIKVTKVICTRSFKARNGDTFVGMSSAVAWDSTQEDGGQGLDQAGEAETDAAAPGLSLADAKIQELILGREVDLLAMDRHLAGSLISEDEHRQGVAGIKHNYMSLLEKAFVKVSSSNGGS